MKMRAPKPHYQAFAAALGTLLDEKGLPPMNYGRMEAFALLMNNRPPSTVQRWLAGAAMPDVETLIEICELIPCSMDRLLGRDATAITPPQSVRVSYYEGAIGLVTQRNLSFALPVALVDRRNRVGPYGVLRITSAEMAGYLDVHDCAFFDMGQTGLLSAACYVLKLDGDRYTVRRIRLSVNRGIDLICDSPQFPPETVHADDLVPYCDELPNDKRIVIMGRIFARYRVEI